VCDIKGTDPSVTVRLAGGKSERSGRLEVYHDGVWGTVCDDDFNNVAAKVACNNLGFGYVTDSSFDFQSAYKQQTIIQKK